MSFLSEFFNLTESSDEQAVCCPFEHKTINGLPYTETNPSSHINTEKGVFHCKACGTGLNEMQFIEKILGCAPMDAMRILKLFSNADTRFVWNETHSLSETGRELAHSFNITDQVITELDITSPANNERILQFPVFMYDQLLDVRTYSPDTKPKVKSRKGATTGLVIPYNHWINTPLTRTTILCAGEKDMAVARSHGLNAITITGGEKSLPKVLRLFKNRVVAICYDNDEAGITGAAEIAAALYAYTDKIKIVTGFHEVCCEPKEDITDFFNKYGKTKEDLIAYIRNTPYFIPTAASSKSTLRHTLPTCDLYTATKPENINRIVQSNIQVVAITDTTFTIPTAVCLEKYKLSGDKDSMQVGESRDWTLDNNNLKDALHLIDNNFKETDIKAHLKTLAYIPKTERHIRINTIAKQTVFKVFVTDLFETNADNNAPMEFQAYSFGVRLDSGKKYLATYKLVPHPYKGQQLVMLITDAVQANDSVSDFKLTEQHKQNLAIIKNTPGTVHDKVENLTEKVKGLLGYNGNNTLIQTLDFAYHTVLQFNLGSFTGVRGYLDTLVVGESRVGKSSTAEALRRVYGLGIFTSLAGNSATIPGLIGGSNKTTNGFQTRAGVIPQNHRGLIIFEEFGKCKQDIVSELTDIRSSNEVRIARVSGTITLPALVRMIALTNVKNTGSTIKPIASYPDGISIITELVGTAEDIARYDLITVLADRGNAQIDPFWRPQEALPTEVYRSRVRWVWSRTPEQINISESVGRYLIERANALNQDYDCHIKIFGTEAWKKLARLAIAVAGYTVSTDTEYQNIIVTKEHVDYAEAFFKRLYDNSTFKLKEYVRTERAYSTIDADGITALQNLYTKHPALLHQLVKTAVCSKNMLLSASGLANEELNKALSQLTRALFIRYQGHDIIPTQRFRIGISKINTNTVVTRVGEEYAPV